MFTRLRNKRFWQEVGASALLTVIVSVPTMAVIAHAPELLQEWKSMRQDYGPGTAYALIAIIVILGSALAIPGAMLAWQSRGRFDWLLGKSEDESENA